MTYRSDRDITQELMPIRFFGSVVEHGADREHTDVDRFRSIFRQAEFDVVGNLPEKKKQAILRRSWRIHDDVIKPYRDAQIAVAKFGLIVFYVLDKLRQQGLFHLVDGSPLDTAVSALLSEEGTLVQFANITKIDQSAQKQARRMLAQLQENGLYLGATWE